MMVDGYLKIYFSSVANRRLKIEIKVTKINHIYEFKRRKCTCDAKIQVDVESRIKYAALQGFGLHLE